MFYLTDVMGRQSARIRVMSLTAPYLCVNHHSSGVPTVSASVGTIVTIFCVNVHACIYDACIYCVCVHFFYRQI